MNKPRVIELADIPTPEPNVADVDVLRAHGRVFLMYDSSPLPDYSRPDWHEQPSDAYALLEFETCWFLAAGGPNDEAIHNHPLYAHGLRAYGCYEVLDSPWLVERVRIADRDGVFDPRVHGELRHFAFALKEALFECIARRYVVVGTFPNASSAMTRAFDLAWSHR